VKGGGEDGARLEGRADGKSQLRVGYGLVKLEEEGRYHYVDDAISTCTVR